MYKSLGRVPSMAGRQADRARIMSRQRFPTLAHAVEAYYDELKNFVLRRTGSSTLAEDIVQETWLRASAVGIAMPDNPRAYLYRIAANLATDQTRRTRSRGEVAAEDAGLIEFASTEPSADAVVSSREEFAILLQAVSDLPPKCREVFLLYRGQNLPMREIARQLGISESTVERHIARAMVQCRQRLRDAGRDL